MSREDWQSVKLEDRRIDVALDVKFVQNSSPEAPPFQMLHVVIAGVDGVFMLSAHAPDVLTAYDCVVEQVQEAMRDGQIEAATKHHEKARGRPIDTETARRINHIWWRTFAESISYMRDHVLAATLAASGDRRRHEAWDAFLRKRAFLPCKSTASTNFYLWENNHDDQAKKSVA